MSLHRMIPAAQLRSNPEQIRVAMDEEKIEELRSSIAHVGILHPLLVRPAGSDDVVRMAMHSDAELDRYIAAGSVLDIVDGHRRSIAGARAGVTIFPCSVIMDPRLSVHEVMLDTAICREDLTPAEEGWQFVSLAEKHGWSLDQLCERFHKSPHYINERVYLVKRDERVCMAVHTRQLSMAQAKVILTSKVELLTTYLLDQAIVHGANAQSLRVMRDNYENDMAAAEGAAKSHTPDHAAIAAAAPQRTCIWCDGGADPENLRQIDVHWYHERELRTVVDQVAVKNLAKTSAG
jgi:ParB family transcriptional regulator, chromosome partitioning protein